MVDCTIGTVICARLAAHLTAPAAESTI